MEVLRTSVTKNKRVLAATWNRLIKIGHVTMTNVVIRDKDCDKDVTKKKIEKRTKQNFCKL
jgi:hypothetical protein